ncbi:MAG: NAD-dependent epimerase/dehydratase family protein [bacterium]
MSAHVAGSRVLVTGAGGFIGTHLCARLGEQGREVHAVSRQEREPQALKEKGPQDGTVQWRRADLTDAAAVRSTLAAIKPDLIVHLASHVAGSRGLDLILPTFRANLLTTVNLLTAAAEVGCGRILLAGSMEEPGGDDPEAVPASPYAAAKWAARGYARMFHSLYQLPVVLLRIFMVYGPGQRDTTKLVPHVILSLLRGEGPRLGSGRREVDWIYVDDVIDALLAATRAPGIEGRTIDIGSGRLRSIRAVVEELVRLTGASVEPLFGAIPDRPREPERIADAAGTAAVLGWTSATSLEEGLERTVAWYRAHLPEAAALPGGRVLRR